ncbi:MAG: hypothetical protein V3T56_01110 [Gemmatimonadales bacterium]
MRGVLLAIILPAVLPFELLVGQQDTTDYPPAGFGTLRQEAISIGFRTNEFEIQVVPLDERIIRLLAPDTYRSLHRLKSTKSDELDAVAARYGLRTPNVFLVRFFGVQPRVRFEPEFLTITSQNRLFRVLEIISLSPLWSGRQLNQRETATAIYVFDDGIRIMDPMTLSYAFASTDRWGALVRALETERASVIARAAGRRP